MNRGLTEFESATAAHRAGQHDDALARYARLFESSRADSTMAAMRLSDLIEEWTRLAAEHPPALKALEDVRAGCLEKFWSLQQPTWLQEYLAISERLGRRDDSVLVLDQILQRAPQARSAAFIYGAPILLEEEAWDVASAYVPNALDECRETLRIYDRTAGIFNIAGEERDRILGLFEDKLVMVLLILRNSGREAEVPPVLELLKQRLAVEAFERVRTGGEA